MFSRSLLGTITPESLDLPPKSGRHTAAAATLFLLPSQAASSSFVEQCQVQGRNPAKTSDTYTLRTLLEAPMLSVLPASQQSQLSSFPEGRF